MVQMMPTSPATGYRPTYGVTYQNQLSPISRPGMGYTPGGTMGIPTPGQRPPAPPMGAQVPAMSGALSGANGLAGAPGGYSAMPGGFSGTAPGLAPAAGGGLLGVSTGRTPYEEQKARALAEYDPVNFGPVGGLLASAASMASPVAGLLNVGRHIYNTEETAAYRSKVGQPMDWIDRTLGYFGLTDASAGSIAAGGTITKDAAAAHENQGGMKMNRAAATPVGAGVFGAKPGMGPVGPVMGYRAGPAAPAGGYTAMPGGFSGTAPGLRVVDRGAMAGGGGQIGGAMGAGALGR